MTTISPDNQALTLTAYQQTVDEWVKAHGGYFSPLSQLAQMTEELGEISRVVNRTFGEQKFKATEKDKNLADEFAGLMFAIACLANTTGISLEEALQTHLAKITKRDATRFAS